MKRNNTRRRYSNKVGSFRGGKLRPVSAVMFRAGESGVVEHRTSMELLPIAGRLLTPVTARLTAVFVPLAAVDALMRDGTVGAGNVEILREQAIAGESLVTDELPSPVTEALGIVPRTVAGQKRVSAIARIAHNVAVNHLRERVYKYANLLDRTGTGITPSIINRNAVQRYDGALDPDEHINGQFSADMSNIKLPIRDVNGYGSAFVRAATDNTNRGTQKFKVGHSNANAVNAEMVGTNATGRPTTKIGGNYGDSWLDLGSSHYADLSALYAGDGPGAKADISLVEFYNAQTADRFARMFRDIADQSPMEREEAVLRWVHDLGHQQDRYPFIVAEREATFGMQYNRATDGVGMLSDVTASNFVATLGFTVPVPRSELGGVLMIFAEVRPDEQLSGVPDPDFAYPFEIINQVAEDFKLDPQPVQMRELSETVPAGQESTVAFYTGRNALKRNHIQYGLDRLSDPETVANRSSMWVYNIPASITPTNIIYPENLPHYPWVGQNADVAVYDERTTATITTAMYFGPNPIERVEAIDDFDLFDGE